MNHDLFQTVRLPPCKIPMPEFSRYTDTNLHRYAIMSTSLSDQEIARVREILVIYYGRDIEIQRVDRQIFLDLADQSPVVRPALLWNADGANFVFTKIAASTFRGRFYYTPHDQYTATESEYNDVDACVNSTLAARRSNPRA